MRYFFPSPEEYLRKVAAPIIKNRSLYETLKLIPEKREEAKVLLQQRCIAKLQERKRKLQENLKYVQTVTPSYSNYYIQTYFQVRHTNPVDVDTRYAILVEASKYKSQKTIEFLHKVNATERNFHLRNFAFLTLQRFGIQEVHLRANRKGKAGYDLIPTPINTPDDLICFIYNSQLEQMKNFDLFLSHSSLDSELLLDLKAILNHSDINIYVDWVNDRDALKREFTNVNTAQAIIERLKSSKALLYVHTDACQNSRWTPWELGFFHALKNKICVYNPNNIEIAPYLEIYPIAFIEDKKFFVRTGGETVELKEWIKK